MDATPFPSWEVNILRLDFAGFLTNFFADFRLKLGECASAVYCIPVIRGTRSGAGKQSHIQPDNINMAVLFWYLVNSVRCCTVVYTGRFTRTARPCKLFSGHPTQWDFPKPKNKIIIFGPKKKIKRLFDPEIKRLFGPEKKPFWSQIKKTFWPQIKKKKFGNKLKRLFGPEIKRLVISGQKVLLI